MKKGLLLLKFAFVSLFILQASSVAVAKEKSKKVTHVVMVWLKEPGNEKMRSEFIQASKKLSSLPGIVNRHVGVVMSGDRKIVDDTFDVAVSVTLESKEALKAYLKNPEHKKNSA